MGRIYWRADQERIVMDQPSMWISTCNEMIHDREVIIGVMFFLIGLMFGIGIMGWAHSEPKKKEVVWRRGL